MEKPISTADYRKYPKGPNFLLVVILSVITILVFLVGAYLLLSEDGRKLLPGLHHNPHPTSYTRPPASSTMAA
jgi:hypothetical protein